MLRKFFTSQIASRYQTGVILILFVISLFLVSSSFLLTVLNNNESAMSRNADTNAALNSAKENLIAFAVLSGEHYGDAGAGPGHLFCPDTTGNGIAAVSCGSNSLGRLPQAVATLLGNTEISDYGSNFDSQFWFALDDSLRSNPISALNSSTVPTLTLDGAPVAAVLISPGLANATQSRPSNAASNYLEADNISAPDFVSFDALSPDQFNDRLVALSFNEIVSPMTARVAETIKITIDSYHLISGSYPDDASFDDPALLDFSTVMAAAPAWFVSNDWLSQTTYQKLTADSAVIVFNGCAINYGLDFNVAALSRGANRC